MRRITSLEAATLAALLLGGGLALAPEARAGVTVNGSQLNGLTVNGLTVNGLTVNGIGTNTGSLQGRSTNGREINSSHPQGQPARSEAVDLGALHVRAIRLPDGRTLLLGQR